MSRKSYLDFQAFFIYYADVSPLAGQTFGCNMDDSAKLSTGVKNRFSHQTREEILLKQTTHELLYEGSGKNLYQTDRPEYLIQEFKGGTTDGRKKGKTKGTGALKNEISSYLFEYLEGFHIPTHFVKQISDTEMMVKRLEIIPIIVKVFNVATGNLAKRFGVKEGTTLTFPIIEHFYKNDELGNPWLNEFHIYAFNLATPEEFRLLNRLASKVNAVLRALAERRSLILASVALEFGRHKGQILLGDELTPATCMFWDRLDSGKANRDAFRLDRPDAEEILTELRNRIQRKA